MKASIEEWLLYGLMGLILAGGLFVIVCGSNEDRERLIQELNNVNRHQVIFH